MNVAVEVVHQEPAGDRDAIFLGDILIEQVLEFHAGGDVPALPQDIDHLAPPPHSWLAPFGACLSNDVRGEAEEGRRMRHPVAHEAGQQLLGVKDRDLSALSCRFHVHALGLEACAPLVPVGKRRRQEEALPVGQGSNAEPADGATEKILILIQLHDVIGCGGVRQNSIPGPRLLKPSTLTLILAMHRSYLYLRRGRCSYREERACSARSQPVRVHRRRPRSSSQAAPGRLPGRPAACRSRPHIYFFPSGENTPPRAEGILAFGIGSEAGPTRASDPTRCRCLPWPSAEPAVSMARRRGSQLASRPGPGTG